MTANIEIHLDRKLADRRLFLEIGIQKSGTRKEELPLQPADLNRVWLDLLPSRMGKTKSNAEFLGSTANGQ